MLDPFYRAVHLPTIFILGAAIGSFLNVCIYRIPQGMSLNYPGSHCYRCGERVRWFDNIPLLSYWLLRGRCRHCGVHFSARYFLVELLTGLLFLGAFLKLGYSLAIIPALVFIGLNVVGTFTDIDHWIIPDRITIGGTAAGIALAAIPALGMAPGNPVAAALWGGIPRALEPLANAVLGAIAGFVMLYMIGWIGSRIFRKEAMGFGDVKLFAMFGAFCGVFHLLHILLLSCLVGTFVGIVGLVRGKLAALRPLPAAVAPLTADPALGEARAARHGLAPLEARVLGAAMAAPGPVGRVRHHLPFGPSLSAAAVAVYFYGPEIEAQFSRFALWLSSALHLFPPVG